MQQAKEVGACDSFLLSSFAAFLGFPETSLPPAFTFASSFSFYSKINLSLASFSA